MIDEGIMHLVERGEGPVAIGDDLLMPEVGIGGKEIHDVRIDRDGWSSVRRDTQIRWRDRPIQFQA